MKYVNRWLFVCVDLSLFMFSWLMIYFLFLFCFWWEGVRLIHWELREGDWQGHSNNERAVWEGERGGRDYLTFGIWSYLTVGLLFGLTLPGVSAHGFLRGGGWGKGLYSSKPYKASSEKDRQRRTERERERTDRKRTERERTSGRRYREIRGGRQEEIEADR